jgi:2-oxoglutarate ferredoxin oxidoreductase subunit gamma
MTTKSFYEEIIIAGFGGQGIMLAGKLLAQTAMKCGKEVTYMQSYSAEVRGGTANCMIVIADEPIACPIVSNPNVLIAMNKASLNKFAPCLKNDGLLIINSSLIKEAPELPGTIETLEIPADNIAIELGSPRSANMAALGAYLQRRQVFSTETATDCLAAVLGAQYQKTIPANAKSLHSGAEYVKKYKTKNGRLKTTV